MANCTRNGWSPNPAELSCSVGMLTDDKMSIQLLAHLHVWPFSIAKQVLMLWLCLTRKYVLGTFLPQLIANMGAVLFCFVLFEVETLKTLIKLGCSKSSVTDLYS